MKWEHANGITRNILSMTITYKLAVCIVILLVAYGCALTRGPLINAANSGEISTIRSLHTKGHDIDEADRHGKTALMYAICSNKVDAAKYLIESGADIKAKNSDGYDALIFSAACGQLEVINILIDKGADIESRDNSGSTPLAHAAYYVPNINAVKLLIKRGADVNARNNESEALLDLALRLYNRMDIITELVNAGATRAALFEPTKGQARLFFIGEGSFWGDTVRVSVEKHSKDLKQDTMAFIDVNPGTCTVVLQISKWLTNRQLSVDVKAGQSYYFLVSPTGAHKAARLTGPIGDLIAKAVTDKKSGGTFEIIPVEESVAKEKIKALLKTIN
ncbi:MAG: ankyrin repeat domain-containing protein [Desulfobacteria bacterium]